MTYLNEDEEFIRVVYGLVYGMGYDKGDMNKAHDAVIKQIEYYIEATSLINETLEILGSFNRRHS